MCLITKLKLADFMSLLKPTFIWKATIVWIRKNKELIDLGDFFLLHSQ